jgi:predicted permease
MRLTRIAVHRFRSLFRRSHAEAEMQSEVEIHLAQLTKEHIAAGLNEVEARRAARIAFGSVEGIKEECRDMRRVRWIQDVGQDLTYAARLFTKSPAFTLTAVLSLALAIGSNTATFAVIDSLLLRKLPVRDPEQLVLFEGYGIDYPLLERLRGLTSAFDGIAAVVMTDRFGVTSAATDTASDMERVAIHLVTGNYLPLMGTQAAIGRSLTPDDDRGAGGPPVVVISDAYWTRKLARAPDVLGRQLRISGTSFTIVGVAQRGFAGDRTGRPADLWIPAAMEPRIMPGCTALRCGAEVRVIGRLKPGVPLQQAEAAAQTVVDQFGKETYHLSVLSGPRLQLQSAARGYAQSLAPLAESLVILMIAVSFILMIACANIANLLLSRCAARRREMAVRLAIGAGMGRITRQLLTESVLLALMGAALGWLFAMWGVRVLAAALASGPAMMMMTASRVTLEAHMDGRVFAFTVALCLLTGVLFGLAPALLSSQVSLSSNLGGRGAGANSSTRGLKLLDVMVLSQVILSFVVLTGTGLFARTLRNLQQENLGVDREHLLLAWTVPVQTGRQGAQLADFWHTVQTRLSGLPGILSASASNNGVLGGGDGGGPSESMRIRGQMPKPGTLVAVTIAAPRFFQAAGIPLIAGREFTEQDNETGPRVAIVNETAAHFYFGNDSPIGQYFAKGNDAGYPWEIVGVVKDAKHGTPRGKRAQFYFPYRQDLSRIQYMCVMLRTAGPPASVAAEVRRELRNIDPTLPVIGVDTVEEQLDDVLVQERVTTVLCGAFSAMSLLLACLGLYGVVAHRVVQRTNEIGIRMALGASPTGVLGLVLTRSLSLAIAGVVIGVPLAIAAARAAASRLFGVSAGDPLTIGGVGLLLISVAALAAYLPARRASRIDPLVALRQE